MFVISARNKRDANLWKQNVVTDVFSAPMVIPPINDGTTLSDGAIAGIAVSSSSLVVFLVFGVVFCWFRRKRRHVTLYHTFRIFILV